jgi:hypothetical protein
MRTWSLTCLPIKTHCTEETATMKHVMNHLPLVLALAFGLSGCDALKEISDQFVVKAPGHPMVVVEPGYEMLVDGQAAQVFGKDKCPPPDEGKRLCIVIVVPETKTVPVTVMLPGGPVDEVWTVERSADRTMLRRADGSYLAAPK